MRIYLVQHGKAADEKDDANRPLTAEGTAETLKAAELCLGAVSPVIIFHSGKLRARQTAEIFERVLRPAKGIRELESISPNDSTDMALKVINSGADDIMIVGHLPHLSKTASKLLTGDENKSIVAFKNSGVICLEKQAHLTWAITPLI